MIGQILARGQSVRGLLYYLFAEGLAGEKGPEFDHVDPRVIAGWDLYDDLAGLQPPAGPGGARDFRQLTSQLNATVLALALGLDAVALRAFKPVCHLAIAASKDRESGAPLDRTLTDEEWADIAREYMDRIGLARRDDDTGVRWVAVRDAEDHVHVVATLVRQDERRPRLQADRYRSMDASRFVEHKYGLVATAATGKTGVPATTRGEQRKHRDTAKRWAGEGRLGPSAPDREVLRRQVRAAAAGASSKAEFFNRLRREGLLVRERMSERNVGEVTGYAVALPTGTGPGWLRSTSVAASLPRT